MEQAIAIMLAAASTGWLVRWIGRGDDGIDARSRGAYMRDLNARMRQASGCERRDE